MTCTLLQALPSSSGQGVSQCLEDAEAFANPLAFNLAEVNKEEVDLKTLGTTFAQYIKVRKAHVEKVLDAGNKAGDSSRDLNYVIELAMYGMTWAMRKSLEIVCLSLAV